MDGIKTYLLGVMGAAVICGIVIRMIGEKGTQGAMTKLIAGLFLAFTVIRPVANIRLDGLSDFTAAYSAAGEQAAAAGESLTKDALAASIKAQTEAYILDKAASLGVELEVDVMLEDTCPMAPKSVRVSGSISPYSRNCLQNIIAQELGISKENQEWTG